ncbi:MAG: DUF6259 domain-containing protein [Phycisphaeraceae bacterium JB051]
MWMQWVGYLDGQNGLLSYCEDRMGSLKFVNAYKQRDGGVGMNWCDLIHLRAGASRDCPYDYVLVPMATPQGFNDLCHEYAMWARNQNWMASAHDKLIARPQLKQVIEQGIVKVPSFGALSYSPTEWKPVRKFLPLDEKKKLEGNPRSFQRILDDIRRTDQMYGIHPAIRHDGWCDRFDSNYPYLLPVHEKLGGDEAFVRYLSENNSEQRTIIFHLNPVQFDTENSQFKPHQVARTLDQRMYTSNWSGNRLALVSPAMVIGENMPVLEQLKAWGSKGIFWDVIGAVSPRIDFNPNAHYPYYDGAQFTQALLGLFTALREKTPKMIFGTEDGQEMMLPYFDFAPSYHAYGDDETVTWAPLNELVYGDAFFNMVGIDGNNRTYEDRGRMTKRLFGSIQGHDLRSAWVKQYDPVVQQEFELNPVLSVVQTQRMIRHDIDPAGWRASYWPNAVVIGNATSEKPLDVTIARTPLGPIKVTGLRRYGFVIVNDRGEFACWGAKSLTCDGQLLVEVNNPDSIIINNQRALTLATYGFFHPKKQPDAKADLNDWQICIPGMTNVMKNGFEAWPSRQSIIKTKAVDEHIFTLDAPGQQTWRIMKDTISK